jgi:hypothetical protein
LRVSVDSDTTPIGDWNRLRAVAVFDDGSSRDVSREVAWFVELGVVEIVASPCSGHVILGRAAGSARIRAEMDGLAAATSFVASDAESERSGRSARYRKRGEDLVVPELAPWKRALPLRRGTRIALVPAVALGDVAGSKIPITESLLRIGPAHLANQGY